MALSDLVVEGEEGAGEPLGHVFGSELADAAQGFLGVRGDDSQQDRLEPRRPAGGIGAMEHEHDDAGRALTRMRELTGGYVPPEGPATPSAACIMAWRNSRGSFAHIHLENNVLFPRAARLERELMG